MNILNLIKKHKWSIVFALLVMVFTFFDTDLSLALAVAPVVLADTANPSGNLEEYDATKNPQGRPADEALQADERGGNTQLQGKSATATDVRDAGLEAEDYDADVVNFRKFRFPIETYIANKCKPVQVKSYVHGHFRSAGTSLEAIYTGSDVAIQAHTNTGKPAEITIDRDKFDNPDCLTEYSTILVSGVDGFAQDGKGNEIVDGELVLFVVNNSDESNKVKFTVLNPPTKKAGVKISANTTFYVAATACSESQIRVAPETYLPERVNVFLQKKNMTCIITDEFEEQDKKTGLFTKDVLANAMYNFKRKCARSHWYGTPTRFDVKVKETGNREAVYTEKGILRQISMLYTHNDTLTDEDMMAITSLQFTDNSVSDSAVAFCGKREMKRLMKLVNSATHFKDVSKVEINEYGIKVRKWKDNFGEIEFVYDPTLDDIGFQDFMVVVDLSNANRYYKRNETTITQDMKQSGESREATAYNKSIIDCVALKGFNAVLVCPSSVAVQAHKLGGIKADFVSVDALPADISTNKEAQKKRYYLTANDTKSGYLKGTIVEWDADLCDWKEFEGLIN